MSLVLANSYFCPENLYINLEFFSDSLWTKMISQTNLNWIIFNVSEVWIKWIASVKWDLSNLKSDVINTNTIANLWYDKNISNFSNIFSNITKNIYSLLNSTQLQTWDTISTFNNSWNTDKFLFYDFRWQAGADNWLWNTWKNLTIRNSAYNEANLWTLNNYQVWVTWKNSLVVLWWNVYIDADIYNNDDKSDLLTIVATRDENNPSKWWNIYINPNVTNIDAMLISEWSIISYSWINALNSIDDTVSLRNQLLIYWNTLTRNLIWENISNFWTDEYINWWWIEVASNYYNLANLRSLNLQFASNNPGDTCWWDDTKVVNMYLASVNKYSFAWKKECFMDDLNKAIKLRETDLVNPLVIEYNPNIQLLKPFLINNR